MTTPSPADLRIQYEGAGSGTDIWGMTQANYLVAVPGGAAREVAVMVNDAASAFLAERYEEPANPEFRRNLVRVVGRLWIAAFHEHHGHLPPLLVISRATFAEQRGLLAEIDRAVGR